jgi:hypothetical protein
MSLNSKGVSLTLIVFSFVHFLPENEKFPFKALLGTLLVV